MPLQSSTPPAGHTSNENRSFECPQPIRGVERLRLPLAAGCGYRSSAYRRPGQRASPANSVRVHELGTESRKLGIPTTNLHATCHRALKRSVFVLPGERCKNGQARVVVLNDIAQSVLDEVRGEHHQYVFTWVNDDGERDRLDRFRNSGWHNARRRATELYEKELGKP